MAEAPWKRDEKAVCRALGAERSGPTGKQGPDCTPPAFWAVQVKRSARPQLPASWLAQAERDAAFPGYEGKRWLLVQACPRRGRPTLFLATLSEEALFEAGGSHSSWPGLMLLRRCARPSLSASELAALEKQPRQPWALLQELPAGRRIVTLDFRELCRLGQLAGLVPRPPEPKKEPPRMSAAPQEPDRPEGSLEEPPQPAAPPEEEPSPPELDDAA